MAIQNSDKLIVGRGDESYQVSLSDSGLAEKDDVVSKVGGDSMEGPLTMKAIDPAAGRATNKINTLGIFSNSESSALRLGTTRDRMYVGHNDVSIAGPLKVEEIQEKNGGNGITISSHLRFEQQSNLISIIPDNGTTQNINLFANYSTDGTGEITTLKVNVNGATYKNAIEFESGASADKDVVLRIDSNKGIRIHNLNMDNTGIRSLADPVADKDAVNKNYVDTQFVNKTGDTMSGNLVIDTSDQLADTEAGLVLTGTRPNLNNSAATITFQNKQATGIGYLTYRSSGSDSYFKFNQNVDLGNNGLHSVAQIRMQNGGYIGSGSNQRIKIRNGGSDSNLAGTEIQRPGDGKRTFAIRGKPANSGTVADFFWAYGNTGAGGDAINYTGLTTNDNHIATKKYVDSKMPYTITKNNGNYYIS